MSSRITSAGTKCLLISFYQAWEEQYSRAESLNRGRARFGEYTSGGVTAAGLYTVKDPNEITGRYKLRLIYQNVGEHTATKIGGYVIMASESLSREPNAKGQMDSPTGKNPGDLLTAFVSFEPTTYLSPTVHSVCIRMYGCRD